MASVFWGSGKPADEVADFDEYDPTPYGGGYDLALTFGRALPPSDETCYPISTASSSSCCSGSGHQQYGRRPGSEDAYGSAAHGRRPDDERHDGHGGYGRKGRINDNDDDGEGRHGAAGGYRKPKPAYGDERPKYHGDGDDDERPTNGRGRKKHGDNDDGSGDERKPRYKKHDDSDDSDGERKRHSDKNNRRRHDYDD
ncbi:hypothetical protein ABZP36_022762 [Zizania latifolia]